MLRTLGYAALAVVLAVPASADHVRHAKGYGKAPANYSYSGGGTITVSCWRGPWEEVIWDRPNAVFIDSLVNVGYSYERASAIAHRVCRDQDLVGNPEGLKSTMRRIYAEGRRN